MPCKFNCAYRCDFVRSLESYRLAYCRTIPSILGDEKSNSIISCNENVITAFFFREHLCSATPRNKKEKERKKKNTSTPHGPLCMVAVFKHRISTLMARSLRRRACASHSLSRSARKKRRTERWAARKYVRFYHFHAHAYSSYDT